MYPMLFKTQWRLTFQPSKDSSTFNIFFTNIEPNFAKTIPKGKDLPMRYLTDRSLKSLYFYLITPDEIIKIIKSFCNNKSPGPESLPTAILKNCADMSCLSQYHIW